MATELYELTIQGLHNGQYVETVMHFEGSNLTANATYENGQDLVISFQTNCLPTWLDCFPASYQVNRLAARRVNLLPSVTYSVQFQMGDQIGTRGSQAAVYNLCPAIALIPTMGTKSLGKIFMPCVGDADVVNNLYLASYQTAIQALIAVLIANFGDAAIEWVLAIFSRKLRTWAHAVSGTPSPAVGFQGRRRKAVGG